MNDLSCGIRIWAQVPFVLSQSTRLTDGQTDRKVYWQYHVLHYMRSHGKDG